MKHKILLIGKMNAMVKDINTCVLKYFNVQLCSENPSVIRGMFEVLEPDLVLISLIGAMDMEPVIFNTLVEKYPDIPVITIGTEGEQKKFLEYYKGTQFEHLIRPIENSVLLEAIIRNLGISQEEFAAAKVEAEAENSQKKKVLVVDDNAATLRSIKAMLDETYDITIATSGLKAMTAMGKRKPDVILLDYEMPVCDGKQTLEMIRSDEELNSLPVIFLTGVNDREHIEAVLKLRPAGYLLKPAIKDALIGAIEKALK